MIFELGQYTLDVDTEQTRLCYENQELLTDGCLCDGCRNYLLAYEIFPDKVKSLFEKLGIDGRKPYDAYVNCIECEGKQRFYSGFYFLCGTIISGISAWKKANPNGSSWDKSYTFEIEKGYNLSFDISDTGISEGFTSPTIIMDFDFHIPWVLDE